MHDASEPLSHGQCRSGMGNIAADDGERHSEVGDKTSRTLTEEEGVKVTNFETQRLKEALEIQAGPEQHVEATGRRVDPGTRESITPSVGSGKSNQNDPMNDSAPTFPSPVKIRDKGKGRDGGEIPMVPYGNAGAALTAGKRKSREPGKLLEKPGSPTEHRDEVTTVDQKTENRRPRSIKKPGFRAWWERHIRVLTPLDGDIRDYLGMYSYGHFLPSPYDPLTMHSSARADLPRSSPHLHGPRDGRGPGRTAVCPSRAVGDYELKPHRHPCHGQGHSVCLDRSCDRRSDGGRMEVCTAAGGDAGRTCNRRRVGYAHGLGAHGIGESDMIGT